MITYRNRNVNGIYHQVMSVLKDDKMRNVLTDELFSRNGPVYKYKVPVVSVYNKPQECVLFDQKRDANPFFHVVEALWMLLGRNDVDTLHHYNSNMKNYSDDGETFHGAYGYRWRHHFVQSSGHTIDQLNMIVNKLLKDPYDRRVVLEMYDPRVDTLYTGKDVPCNTHIYFMARPSNKPERLYLDMTVCCRSNDIIWGQYGANAVHFAFLHSYVAASCNFSVGKMYQLSNNSHVYKDVFDKTELSTKLDLYHEYQKSRRYHEEFIPLVTHSSDYLKDASILLGPDRHKAGQGTNPDPFLMYVVHPMLMAWDCHKNRYYSEAIQWCHEINDAAWRLVSLNWIMKRALNYNEKVSSCPDKA